MTNELEDQLSGPVKTLRFTVKNTAASGGVAKVVRRVSNFWPSGANPN